MYKNFSNLKSFIKYIRIRLFHLKKIFFSNSINFKKFWKNFDKRKLPHEMCEIIDHFLLSESRNFISGWWKYNNIKDIKSLSEKGIENYGKIFFHYYTWYGWSDEEIDGLLKDIENEKISINIDIYKKHDDLSYNESFKLNILLKPLYIVKKRKSLFI